LVIGRATDGQPVFWLQRRRLLPGPPPSNPRDHVLERT
jgi:hypothetical protein